MTECEKSGSCLASGTFLKVKLGLNSSMKAPCTLSLRRSFAMMTAGGGGAAAGSAASLSFQCNSPHTLQGTSCDLLCRLHPAKMSVRSLIPL
jgi:hypothetical protein